MIVFILLVLFQVGLGIASPTPSSSYFLTVMQDDFSNDFSTTTTILITPIATVVFETRTEYATAAPVSQVFQFEAEHSDIEPDESNVPISRSVIIAIAVVLILLILALGGFSCIWASKFWMKFWRSSSSPPNHAQRRSTSSAPWNPAFQRNPITSVTRFNRSFSLPESEYRLDLPRYAPRDVPAYEYPPEYTLPQVPLPTLQVRD
ncbi:hypothetical protein D9758_017331 [Tetrapyrgos nigripes]|uniref:Uncharacterized protein n=1 Tax=Tetrapyrgos nigripes TaxID=182062 RepID=A0A8H5F9I9_9AGAR|nr:hypothetical protein D9758_017331 [Tetrapyrgos nigripes]